MGELYSISLWECGQPTEPLHCHALDNFLESFEQSVFLQVRAGQAGQAEQAEQAEQVGQAEQAGQAGQWQAGWSVE